MQNKFPTKIVKKIVRSATLGLTKQWKLWSLIGLIRPHLLTQRSHILALEALTLVLVQFIPRAEGRIDWLLFHPCLIHWLHGRLLSPGDGASQSLPVQLDGETETWNCWTKTREMHRGGEHIPERKLGTVHVLYHLMQRPGKSNQCQRVLSLFTFVFSLVPCCDGTCEASVPLPWSAKY